MLTLAQPGEQHDLPVGELQRVVVRVWLLHLDLPESSYLLPEFLAPEDLKNMLALHFPLERDLRAGKKTHSYMRFSDGGETTSATEAIVVATFGALLVLGAFLFPPGTKPGHYVIYVVALCGLLIGVCWLKGEPPRWRWGDDERA